MASEKRKKFVKDLKAFGRQSITRIGKTGADAVKKQLNIGAEEQRKRQEMKRKQLEKSIRRDIMKDLRKKGRLKMPKKKRKK